MKMRINLPSNSNYDRLTRLERELGYSNIYASDRDRISEIEKKAGKELSPGFNNKKSIKDRILAMEYRFNSGGGYAYTNPNPCPEV